MKKIAFALQVFSLMMLLPLCVIIEMNHGTVARAEKDIAGGASSKVNMVPAVQSQMKVYKMKS